MRLEDKVAIVTGAAQGIGREYALRFVEEGAAVGVVDTRYEQAKMVEQEIIDRKGKALALRTDVTSREQLDAMAKQVFDRFGRIDILVNNAGILIKSPFLDMSESDWDKIISTNLKGCYLCSQAVGRKMVDQKSGVIINVASQYAFRVTPGMGGYSIAKAGVAMLTRVLARELGPHNVRANAVAPGLARTDFSKASWSDPQFLKQYESSVPLGRIAETGDLTGAILFLASQASRYVTGHTILVDGGALA